MGEKGARHRTILGRLRKPAIRRSRAGYPASAGIAAAPTVAILNSASDVIGAIREALERDGFGVVSAYISEIQDGTLDLVAFIARHDPAVIVCDVPVPYERHFNSLRLIRDTMSLRERCWGLTTTDKAAVAVVAKPHDLVHVIVGQPFTMADVVAAVRGCLRVTAAPASSRASGPMSS